MKRVEKLYKSLDAQVEQYNKQLIKEFEKGDNWDECSWYLEKKRREDDKGRIDTIHGSGLFVDANDLLSLEKKLRQLCLQLNEPLPLPLQILEEYITSFQELKHQKTKLPWKVEDFKGEHTQLKHQMHQKLLDWTTNSKANPWK